MRHDRVRGLRADPSIKKWLTFIVGQANTHEMLTPNAIASISRQVRKFSWLGLWSKSVLAPDTNANSRSLLTLKCCTPTCQPSISSYKTIKFLQATLSQQFYIQHYKTYILPNEKSKHQRPIFRCTLLCGGLVDVDHSGIHH